MIAPTTGRGLVPACSMPTIKSQVSWAKRVPHFSLVLGEVGNSDECFLRDYPKNKNAGLVGPAASLSLICGERLVYVFVPADL